MPVTPPGRGAVRTTTRTGQLPLRPGQVNAFTSRRAPGSRRSGTGMSPSQRGIRNRWGLIILVTLLVVVVGRLAVLQGVDGAALATAAEEDRLQTFEVAASTGTALPSPTRSRRRGWSPTRSWFPTRRRRRWR